MLWKVAEMLFGSIDLNLIGRVVSMADGVATVSGLHGVLARELVMGTNSNLIDGANLLRFPSFIDVLLGSLKEATLLIIILTVILSYIDSSKVNFLLSQKMIF